MARVWRPQQRSWAKWGAPHQGHNFEARLVCQRLGVKKTWTTPLHARVTGWWNSLAALWPCSSPSSPTASSRTGTSTYLWSAGCSGLQFRSLRTALLLHSCCARLDYFAKLKNKGGELARGALTEAVVWQEQANDSRCTGEDFALGAQVWLFNPARKKGENNGEKMDRALHGVGSVDGHGLPSAAGGWPQGGHPSRLVVHLSAPRQYRRALRRGSSPVTPMALGPTGAVDVYPRTSGTLFGCMGWRGCYCSPVFIIYVLHVILFVCCSSVVLLWFVVSCTVGCYLSLSAIVTFPLLVMCVCESSSLKWQINSSSPCIESTDSAS